MNDIMNGNVAWGSTSIASENDHCTQCTNNRNNTLYLSNNKNMNNTLNNTSRFSVNPQIQTQTVSHSQSLQPHQSSSMYTTNRVNTLPSSSSYQSNQFGSIQSNDMVCNGCNGCNQCKQCINQCNQCNVDCNSNNTLNTFTINAINATMTTMSNQHKNEINQLNDTLNSCKNELIRMNKEKYEQQQKLQQKLQEQQRKIKEMEQLIQQTMDIESRPSYKGKCPTMHLAAEIIEKYLNVPSEFMNPFNDKCFCDKCHKKRNQYDVYPRGSPPKKYCLPIGWVRFGLTVDEGKCKMNKVFKHWHVAYHGTNSDTAKQIFKSGLNLLKPGDYTIDGRKLSISDGHIRSCNWRHNHYLNQNEWFDPNQIFVSPSIIYASNEIYAKPFYCFNNTVKVQCVFQLRIRPNSYGIGQETINATKRYHIIDSNFNNNELEWYTKQNLGIVVHGLLVKITSNRNNNNNNNNNNDNDPMYIDLT